MPAAVKVLVKRRAMRTEEELLDEAWTAPSLALDRSPSRAESAGVILATRRAVEAGKTNNDVTLSLLDRRADLAGLPLRRGQACRLSPTAAAHLDDGSKALRGLDRDAAVLQKTLADDDPKVNKWLKAETVPVLMQMLMAETAAVREVLAEQLSRIEGKPATEALVQLALFDLHPGVRERAINGLAARPAVDYRLTLTLLQGFEHPWPAIADHAAEALVALKMRETVPLLVRVLERPDPRALYRKPGGTMSFVKELVRVNHLRNCLLCHAPSFSLEDKVRGLVPSPNQPLNSVAYYQAPGAIFVRADITYLKQDFSAMLAVSDPGKWPAVQRFDFFVRERFALERDRVESAARKQAGRIPQQQAAMFALRELTGEDPGPTVADWKRFLLGQPIGRWSVIAAP